MNRLLSVVRSRTDRSVELSRGVVRAAAYGESKRLLEVDQIKNVILTTHDRRNVGARPRCGEFSAFLDGSQGAVCGPRNGVRAGGALGVSVVALESSYRSTLWDRHGGRLGRHAGPAAVNCGARTRT